MRHSRVSDERLDVIHLQVSSAVRRRRANYKKKFWLELEGQAIIEAHDLANLLDELKKRRLRKGFQLGQTSKLLAEMQVGDRVVVPQMARSKLASARKTARHRLEAPTAVWRSRLLPDGQLEIIRKPDGTSPHEPQTNPTVLELIKMNVGEFKFFDVGKGFSNQGYLPNGMKVRARQLMNKPHANWRCIRITKNRLRCERVS